VSSRITRISFGIVALALMCAAAQSIASLEAKQEAPRQGSEQARAIAKADTGVGHYFTDVQARRGERLYNRHCGYCHVMDGAPRPTISGIQGPALSPRLLQRAVEGVSRYPSVYYLFRRLDYMPVDDTQSVSPQQKADILAYMLEQNGLLAGDNELRPDYAAMRAMPLPAEPAFVHVFNGRDLAGWKFLLGYHCTPPPNGCGKTDPSGVFWAKDGVFATSGQRHGMAYLPDKYSNFTLRVEQRIPYEWDDDDMLLQDQTGWLLYVNGTMRVWAEKFIEVEGRYFDLLGISAVGVKAKVTVDHDARRRVIRRVNDWQRVEIVAKDGVIKNYLNGTLISTVEAAEPLVPGYIGFQSQGGPVEWRNIRIKVE
jgi:cytochrome c5